MILSTALRWLWIVIAFCLSASVAVAALFFLGALWAGEGLREVAAQHGDRLLWETSDVFGALFFAAAVAPALTALPGLVAVIVGELFRIRSALYYILAGGAALIAIPLLAVRSAPAEQAAAPAAEYMTLFAAAGFAGGFCYWLLAGRRA